MVCVGLGGGGGGGVGGGGSTLSMMFAIFSGSIVFMTRIKWKACSPCWVQARQARQARGRQGAGKGQARGRQIEPDCMLVTTPPILLVSYNSVRIVKEMTTWATTKAHTIFEWCLRCRPCICAHAHDRGWTMFILTAVLTRAATASMRLDRRRSTTR